MCLCRWRKLHLRMLYSPDITTVLNAAKRADGGVIEFISGVVRTLPGRDGRQLSTLLNNINVRALIWLPNPTQRPSENESSKFPGMRLLSLMLKASQFVPSQEKDAKPFACKTCTKQKIPEKSSLFVMSAGMKLPHIAWCCGKESLLANSVWAFTCDFLQCAIYMFHVSVVQSTQNPGQDVVAQSEARCHSDAPESKRPDSDCHRPAVVQLSTARSRAVGAKRRCVVS